MINKIINIILYFILIENVFTFKSCIVLFTGGSNTMSAGIYTDFLTNLNNSHKIIKKPFIFRDNLDYLKLDNLKLDNLKLDNLKLDNCILDNLEILKDEYQSITYLAHSSGATTAINKINPLVNRLILLDPVATPNIDYNINLDTLYSIDIINAELSYKWTYKPPFLPFIPIFKLDPNRLKINKQFVNIEIIKNYGHADLIDNPYRNLMHYTGLSRGNNDRKKSIREYHQLLVEKINCIIYQL